MPWWAGNGADLHKYPGCLRHGRYATTIGAIAGLPRHFVTALGYSPRKPLSHIRIRSIPDPIFPSACREARGAVRERPCFLRALTPQVLLCYNMFLEIRPKATATAPPELWCGLSILSQLVMASRTVHHFNAITYGHQSGRRRRWSFGVCLPLTRRRPARRTTPHAAGHYGTTRPACAVRCRVACRAAWPRSHRRPLCISGAPSSPMKRRV